MTAIGTGRDHGLAVLGDGTVRSWGGNAFGQLGDDTTNRTTPVAVSGLTEVSAVTAGRACSTALVGA